MDAFHIAKDDVDQMAAYWMMRKGRLLGWTGDLFTALVDPAFLYEDAIDEMMLAEYNMCFTEWLLYECKMLDGDTPLQLYLADPPTGALPEMLARLHEVEQTQFFSRFAILDKDPDHGIAKLCDIRTGIRYTVFDPHLCAIASWREGVIAMRIARVDRMWQTVGQVHLYDVARSEDASDDGPGEFHPEDREERPYLGGAGFFVRLVFDLFSVDGRYRNTVRLREVDTVKQVEEIRRRLSYDDASRKG